MRREERRRKEERGGEGEFRGMGKEDRRERRLSAGGGRTVDWRG